MKVGSEEHKELFCRSIIDTHCQLEPEALPWPQLDDLYLERLRAIPFWDEALKTELEAGAVVGGFAETQSDPLLREAIAVQGREEARHARLIRYMVERYEIQIEEPRPDPLRQDLKAAFVYFGFGECLDSFGAFGLFDLARQAAYMPKPFFDIFDRVLDEEARHIVFFVNWYAYHQVQAGRGAAPLRAATSLWHYGKVLGHLIGVIRDASKENEGFTAVGAKTFMDDLTARDFLATSIKENSRRMAGLDARLLQPRLLPSIARGALRLMKLIPQKKSLSAATS